MESTSGPIYDFFAVALPGLEPLVAAELAELGLSGAAPEEGGVSFRAPLLAAFRANLTSRLATRVLLRLGTFRAETPDVLAAGLATLPWALVLRPGTALDVRVASHRSRLRGPRLEPTATAAVARVRDRLSGPPEATERPPQRVQLRLVDDVCTASVDLSGERLDRRGYRTRTAVAPLRETLAAAVLRLAGWTPGQPLVDPLCGVGTVAIEAAQMALGVLPGRDRAFPFTGWPSFDAAAWAAVLATADAARRTRPPFPILASDAAEKAVADARVNAERAGVLGAIDFATRPLADVVPPAGAPGGGAVSLPCPPGLVVADPPYGHRMGSRGALKPLYRQLGAVLSTRFRGWRAAVLCPDRRLERELRLLVVDRHALPHGGRRVDLLIAAL